MGRISPLELWLVLIAGGLLTYGIRLSFIILFGRLGNPARLIKALRFVPPAVLSAIIFPEILVKDNRLFLDPSNPRLIAGLLAALVAWRTRNAVLTIVAGMAALLIIDALFP